MSTSKEPGARYSTVRTDISGNIFPSKISGNVYLLKCAFYRRDLSCRDYIYYPEGLIHRRCASYPNGLYLFPERIGREDCPYDRRGLIPRYYTYSPKNPEYYIYYPKDLIRRILCLVSGRVGTQASHLLTERIDTQKIVLFGPDPI